MTDVPMRYLPAFDKLIPVTQEDWDRATELLARYSAGPIEANMYFALKKIVDESFGSIKKQTMVRSELQKLLQSLKELDDD